MSKLQSVAFIGNHLPRRCGIATFTHDLRQAVANAQSDLDTYVVAMNDESGVYDYPPAVRFQVRQNVLHDYHKAAAHLNDAAPDVVSLQHEYGIFGGDAGANILDVISRLRMPIVTTLHTVLAAPSSTQRAVLDGIIEHSAKLVVMSDKGRHFLQTVHGVAADRIQIIPHGIPEFPFIEPQAAKTKLGYAGRSVILTFGLLSPSKGIETVIDAMPMIIKSCRNAIYVVLGATHPNLVRDQGEAYREGLVQRARQLGVADHVVFCNEFVDQATLLEYISMCDVYVTPYLSEAQMTSGTLAYSFGLGKAVVSTPYWHAQELLADGKGVLIPFADAAKTGEEIASLLTNDVRRHAIRKRAYSTSRSMTWPWTAKSYISVFKDACDTIGYASRRTERLVGGYTSEGAALTDVPELKTDHLLSMCDSTGLLQHAVHCVPDRSHGYCVDDNARALLLACSLGNDGEARLPEKLTARFAAFIQHAWNPDTQRFRNFMSYDRNWLEAIGSEDSHGRTLWALAECATSDIERSRRGWAANLFRTALSPAEDFSSPRAWAFTLLGLNAYCATFPDDLAANRVRHQLANQLLAILSANSAGSWHWFENVLAYDNARLPQALIGAGHATGTPAYIEGGLGALRWLMAHQIGDSGCFRPVGSDSFGKIRRRPEMFDQQPVETTATIAACLSAARVDGSSEWPANSMRAFAWFLGANDLKVPLVDFTTGGCLDGLHSDRANQNMGAESVLSYLLALVDIRQFARAGGASGASMIGAQLALSA